MKSRERVTFEVHGRDMTELRTSAEEVLRVLVGDAEFGTFAFTLSIYPRTMVWGSDVPVLWTARVEAT